MKQTSEFTPDEMTFLRRMVPHLETGKSLEESAAAVLADDQRIATMVLDHSYSERESNERQSIRRKRGLPKVRLREVAALMLATGLVRRYVPGAEPWC